MGHTQTTPFYGYHYSIFPAGCQGGPGRGERFFRSETRESGGGNIPYREVKLRRLSGANKADILSDGMIMHGYAVFYVINQNTVDNLSVYMLQ